MPTPPATPLLRFPALARGVLVAALALGPLAGAGAAEARAPAEPAAAALFSLASPLTAKELERAAAKLDESERLPFLVVGLELFADPASRVARLSPLIAGRREAAAAHPYAACSLVDALVQSGSIAAARTVIAMLPEAAANDLERADADSARAVLALASKLPAEARALLVSATAGLQRSAPEAAYVTWRHHLVRRRLERVSRAVDGSAATELGGPAYAAWLQADRGRSLAGYQRVATDHPGTIFAAAAELEAIRLRLAAGDAGDCLRALDEPRWRQGPLAVPAMLLRGDGLLQSGRRWGEAKGAYEEALRLLQRPADGALALDPATRAAITPAKPLHRQDADGYPRWATRPVGAILVPGLEADTAAYLRYQAVVRLAVVTYAAGDQPAAVALARTLVMFDDVDRDMVLRQKGAGGTILCDLLETGSALVPLDGLRSAPADLQARAIMGIGFYQIYDWEQARDWLAAVLPRIPAAQGQARDTVGVMLASSEAMLGRNPQALAASAGVRLKAGAAPTVAWFRARNLENSIHMQAPADYPAALAALQEVRDLAPGSAFAQDALRFQATCAEAFDLPLAKRLWQDFRRAYPGVSTESVTFALQNIDQRLAATGRP